MKVADAVSSFLLHCQYGKNLSSRTLKAYATGARVSEIAHLRRENLDLDQGRVRILGKVNLDTPMPPRYLNVASQH